LGILRKQPALGNNPRARGERHHKHSDFSVHIAELNEDDLMELVSKLGHSALILILDSVQDPHNLGACLRTAAAAGADAVVAPKDRAVAITDTVRRIASGGAENVPFVRVTNLARTIDQLKDAGLWIVGTSDKGVQSLYEIDLKGPVAIVMGAEGEGIRRLTQDKCDFLARIPMKGKVDCLNVSVAAGVCLFEAVRQREKG
jgi:23S rRNA (guanosine2251-2'-O)-methyltransferase